MSVLSRDDILNASDRPTRNVEVPEWGGTVIVRGLSGAERDAYEASMVVTSPGGKVRTNMRNIRARLVAMACVDSDGARLFTDSDVDALGDKSAAAMERVFDVARTLSGLTDDDVEELAEGFGDAPSEGSTSV